jgi:hypothetical protein
MLFATGRTDIYYIYTNNFFIEYIQMPAKGGTVTARKPKADKLLDFFEKRSEGSMLRGLMDNLNNLSMVTFSTEELQNYDKVAKGGKNPYTKAIDAVDDLLPDNYRKLTEAQKEIAIDYLLLNFGMPIYRGSRLLNQLDLKKAQLTNIIYTGQLLNSKFVDSIKIIAPALSMTTKMVSATDDRKSLNEIDKLTKKQNYSTIEAAIIDLSNPSITEEQISEIQQKIISYTSSVEENITPVATSKEVAVGIFAGSTPISTPDPTPTPGQAPEQFIPKHSTHGQAGNPDYTGPTLGASIPAHSSQNPSSAAHGFQTGDNRPSSNIPKATPGQNEELAKGLSIGLMAEERIYEANLITASQVARQNLLLKSNMISAKQQKPQKAFKKKELTFEEWMKIIETRELEALKLNVDQMNVMQLNEVMQEKQRNIDRQINSNLTWGIPLVKN